MKRFKKNAIRTLDEFLGYPLNSGIGILNRFAKLPNAIDVGTELQRAVFVPGTREDRVVLVAHADTVWNDGGWRSRYPGYTFYDREGIGADDRAGCAMLWLLKDSGHSLLITNGEESGGQGSNYIMKNEPELANIINTHRFMVEFDRRGNNDIITYGVGSDEFRTYLAKSLKGFKLGFGSFTDICILCRDICGVNLSVGYYNEHSAQERINIHEWYNTFILAKHWLENPMPKFILTENSRYSKFSNNFNTFNKCTEHDYDYDYDYCYYDECGDRWRDFSDNVGRRKEDREIKQLPYFPKKEKTESLLDIVRESNNNLVREFKREFPSVFENKRLVF